MIKDTIEKAKNAVENLIIDQDQKIGIQKMLSEIRTELLCLDKDANEARIRQNVYAEISEKMLTLMAERHYG